VNSLHVIGVERLCSEFLAYEGGAVTHSAIGDPQVFLFAILDHFQANALESFPEGVMRTVDRPKFSPVTLYVVRELVPVRHYFLRPVKTDSAGLVSRLTDVFAIKVRNGAYCAWYILIDELVSE